MSRKNIKIACIALSLVTLSGCNTFSEDKLSAYVGSSNEEYSQISYNYAYNAPAQTPVSAPQASFGGYYPISSYNNAPAASPGTW